MMDWWARGAEASVIYDDEPKGVITERWGAGQAQPAMPGGGPGVSVGP
jgi:hypothetical protein